MKSVSVVTPSNIFRRTRFGGWISPHMKPSFLRTRQNPRSKELSMPFLPVDIMGKKGSCDNHTGGSGPGARAYSVERELHLGSSTTMHIGLEEKVVTKMGGLSIQLHSVEVLFGCCQWSRPFILLFIFLACSVSFRTPLPERIKIDFTVVAWLLSICENITTG